MTTTQYQADRIAALQFQLSYATSPDKVRELRARLYAIAPELRVTDALRAGATAILERDSPSMAVAWSDLTALLDRQLFGGERYRVVRMIQGLERRMRP